MSKEQVLKELMLGIKDNCVDPNRLSDSDLWSLMMALYFYREVANVSPFMQTGLPRDGVTYSWLVNRFNQGQLCLPASELPSSIRDGRVTEAYRAAVVGCHMIVRNPIVVPPEDYDGMLSWLGTMVED